MHSKEIADDRLAFSVGILSIAILGLTTEIDVKAQEKRATIPPRGTFSSRSQIAGEVCFRLSQST